MLFKNVWVDPTNVVAVNFDSESKRFTVLLKEPPQTVIPCDVESGRKLLRYLDGHKPEQPK